jgi:hypothetical protein
LTNRQDLPSGGYFVAPLWLVKLFATAIVSLVLGVFYVGWHMATLDNRVHSLEKQAGVMERVTAERQIERDRLTIVEQQVAAMARILDRIDRRLDRVIGAEPAPR